MQLNTLASQIKTSQLVGDGLTQITGIETDSRKVKPGDLFICIQGFTVDGHDFAAKAAEMGAAALVVSKDVDVNLPKIIVNDTRYAMARLASHFYDYPSSKFRLIGVTGTNGKTTTSFLLDKIFADQAKRTALMGTIHMKIGDRITDARNTTQESIDLQKHFAQMVKEQIEVCTMEVSSHALEQGRVKGCDFNTAIFTNLTQDHLDYHETMENYRDAKGLFFSRLGNAFGKAPEDQKFAVLNADDAASAVYRSMTAAEVVTYGIDHDADVKANNIRITPQGTHFYLTSFAGEAQFHLQMIGKFSVYNALAAITAALLEGIPLHEIQQSLEAVKGVDGRFEAVQAGQPFLVIVDYAHTPDSLDNVLSTIKEFVHGKLLCVFGCGGDRDRTKRPLMAKIVAKYSDHVFATSDNPRTEDPERILSDIEKGLVEVGYPAEQYDIILDRKKAIQLAIDQASPDDVVLIAGKGHETYQEINGVRHDFDDRVAAKEAIRRNYSD